MLDQETQTRKPRGGILQGQRILVLGANCGFGRSMARAFKASGAQVVVADANTDALQQIKGAVPLTLRGSPSEALRRVGRAWGEAQLDGVLNLMPLRHSDQIDMNIAVLQGIVQGFMPALCARGGQILTVVSRPDQPLDVGAGAMAPAVVSAQAALSHAMKRDGLRLNTVSVGEGSMTPARQAVVGLLANTLGPLTGAELRV